MQEEAALTDIDALATALNLGKDRLRKWEQRYGFPRPVRGADGRRRYPQDQVERLKLICRLLDQGERAGKLLRLSDEALRQRAGTDRPAAEGSGAGALLRQLQEALDRIGLPQPGQVTAWIENQLVPLIRRIGTAWAEGALEIWAEHLLTEQIQRRLALLLDRPQSGEGPTVLLCTLPGEPHRLGMMMAELVLREAGVRTLCLGAEVEPAQIAAAVRASGAARVALSFSPHQKRAAILRAVAALQRELPETPIWLGGGGASQLRRLPQGVQAIRSLAMLASAARSIRRSGQ